MEQKGPSGWLHTGLQFVLKVEPVVDSPNTNRSERKFGQPFFSAALFSGITSDRGLGALTLD